MKTETGKKSIQSIERMDEILTYLLSQPRGERLSKIAADLGLNKSTAFGLISTLEQLHYLEQDQETGRYYLGMKLFELGQAAYSRLDFVAVARPYIARLCEKYEETVHIAVLAVPEVVYLDKVESSRSMRVSTQIGGRQEVYCTALGKALLAYQSEDVVENVIRRTNFKRLTPTTLDTPEKLREELVRIRQQGYSLDNEESELGLFCVAAPVFNGERENIAAISIAGPVKRVKDAGGQQLLRDVVETAALISTNLGYHH